MTMEALESDFEEIKSATKTLGPLTTMSELATFLRTQLVPFIEAHVAETTEIDNCVSELLDRTEDILQPETAQVFAAAFAVSRAVAAKLVEIMPKDEAGKAADPKVHELLQQWEAFTVGAERLLEEITMPESDEDDEDEDPGEDEDGDGEDDEEGAVEP